MRDKTWLNAIQVWRFHDAPKWMKDLSEHGGDEDWLAFIPALFPDKSPLWAETGTAFGCCDVSRHELEDGSIILIGAHA